MTSDDDQTELPDLTHLAEQNLFVADEQANQGANHVEEDLPDDAAIRYQDPEARLDEGLG